MQKKKTKAAPTVQVGRSTRQARPVSERERLATRVRQRDERDEQHRKQLAVLRRENTRLKDDRHRADCENVATLNAMAAGLSKTDALRVINVVEAERRRFVRNEANAGRVFDPYSAARRKIAEIKKGVAPADPNANAQDLQRVPMPPSGKLPPASPEEQARQAEERRKAQERTKRLAEDREREREAYRKRLQELGLRDPSSPTPGDPRGLNCG